MGLYYSQDQQKQWIKEIKEALPGLPTFDVLLRTKQDAAYLPEEALEVRLQASDKIIASFLLVPAIDSALLWSYGMAVARDFRRKGIAWELMKQKKRMCRDMGYVGLVASVNNENKAQITLLKKAAWKPLMPFDRNNTTLWACDLSRADRQYI